MNANEIRIRFAVKLASLDLKTLRPGDWQNLATELSAEYFLPRRTQGESLALGVMNLKKVAGFSPEEFERLQAETRKVLTQVAAYRVNSGAMRRLSAQKFEDVEAQVMALVERLPAIQETPLQTRKAVLATSGNATCVGVAGPVRDVFLELLFDALAKSPNDRVQTCPEPDCGRLFYRVGRRITAAPRARTGGTGDGTRTRRRPRRGRSGTTRTTGQWARRVGSSRPRKPARRAEREPKVSATVSAREKGRPKAAVIFRSLM